VAAAAAGACLAAGSLAAQTDNSKCTWIGVNGKTVTDMCAYAPPGAKQLNPPPATPSPTPPAQPFPFPGENPNANPAQNPAAPQNQVAQPGTQAPAATDSSAPASKRFPFPGENPDPTAPEPPAAPAPAPNPNGLQDAGSQGDSAKPLPGESSSSSSSSSSNPEAAADPNDPPDAAPIPHHSRRPLPTMKAKTPDEREADDVSVAAFYMNDGNYLGAYMRGKDAVSLDDTDPEAHLALAEAARKLGKLDEAQQHYNRCLELDPLPKDRKVAQQALKAMAGKS